MTFHNYGRLKTAEDSNSQRPTHV